MKPLAHFAMHRRIDREIFKSVLVSLLSETSNNKESMDYKRFSFCVVIINDEHAKPRFKR